MHVPGRAVEGEVQRRWLVSIIVGGDEELVFPIGTGQLQGLAFSRIGELGRNVFSTARGTGNTHTPQYDKGEKG